MTAAEPGVWSQALYEASLAAPVPEPEPSVIHEAAPEAEHPDFQTFTPAELASIARRYLTSQEGRKEISSSLLGLTVKDKAEELHRAATNPTEPLRVMTTAELWELPDPEWWIEGLIQQDTDVVLAGQSNLGKSFLMIHGASAMAGGMPFFGLQTKQAKTLYLAGEGASAFGKRTRAWEARYGVGLAFTDRAEVHYVTQGVNLSVETAVDELREVFRAGQYDLLVVDTYSQLSGVLDENHAAENARVLRAIKSIRQTVPGASSVTIHHLNAQGTKARGSTVLVANVDTVVMMKPEGDHGFSITTDARQGGKQKDGKPITMKGFKLDDSEGSAVVVIDSPETSERFEKVTAVLADGEEHKSKEIQEACGITGTSGKEYDQWRKDMTRWSADEETSPLVRGGNRTYATYRLRWPAAGNSQTGKEVEAA